MIQWFWIPGKLPGFNEIVAAAKILVKGRKGKTFSGYAAFKRSHEAVIGWAILEAKLRPVARARLRFYWIEPDIRRDIDNCAAAKKLILDSLVNTGVLPGDSREYVTGFQDEFPAPNSRYPGVLVILES